MTVTKTNASVLHETDGLVTDFPFEFAIGVSSNLSVQLISSTGDVTDVPDTDYTVVITGAESGYVAMNSAPSAGQKLYVARQTQITQLIAVTGQTKYDPVVVERVWDKLTQITQELQTLVNRAILTVPGFPPENYLDIIAELRDEAANAASTAEAWAESPTPPNPSDPESKSAKTWAAQAEAAAARIDLGALDAAVEQTGLDRIATGLDRLAAETAAAQIAPAVAAASGFANAASADATRAEAARDAAIAAGAWDYTPIDDTALAAITEMTEGQTALVIETMHVWSYDGSDWIDTGESPLALKANAGPDAIPPEYLDTTFRVGKNLVDPTKIRRGRGFSPVNGGIFANSARRCTDFIPVEPGQSVSISGSQYGAGIGFFAAAADDADFTNATSSYPNDGTGRASGTAVVPAGRYFVVVNTTDSGQDDLTYDATVQVEIGPAVTDYAPYRLIVRDDRLPDFATPADVDGVRSDLDNIATSRDSLNLFDQASIRTGFYVGNNGTISAEPGWSCGDAACAPGDTLTISAGGERRSGLAFYDGAGAYIAGSFTATNTNPMTVTAPAGAARMTFNIQSNSIPQPAAIMVNLGAEALPWEPFGTIWSVREAALPTSTGAVSHLVLAGEGMGVSYVESNRAGYRLRNSFVAFPPERIGTLPCRLNLMSVTLNGVLLRADDDDIAPDHIEGTTLGANHGYVLGRCTAAGHGKTTADEGSRWTSGGVACVLVQRIDANTLLIAREASNTAPATGTYTHVSGASATGDITVSAVTAAQWYPPHRDYAMRVLVDGVEISDRDGEWTYRDSVQFVETAYFLRRSDIIDWWIANGGASGGFEPQTDPVMMQIVTYSFDRDGQLSIASQWVALREMPLQDLMGLQVTRTVATAPDQYVIPGALPLTYDGETLDYAMGVASGRTLAAAGTPSIYLADDQLQAEGEYAHRALSLWPGAVLAVGFLPQGDAAYDVRRARVSNQALEIRGSSGKLYFRALDIGAHTAQPGDSYSVIGYRHVTPRSPDRTSLYTVRTAGAAYVYADWIDWSGLDLLPLPADLTGRAFEVVEARNCTVKSGVLAGALPVLVDAEDAAAALIMRVLT